MAGAVPRARARAVSGREWVVQLMVVVTRTSFEGARTNTTILDQSRTKESNCHGTWFCDDDDIDEIAAEMMIMMMVVVVGVPVVGFHPCGFEMLRALNKVLCCRRCCSCCCDCCCGLKRVGTQERSMLSLSNRRKDLDEVV